MPPLLWFIASPNDAIVKEITNPTENHHDPFDYCRGECMHAPDSPTECRCHPTRTSGGASSGSIANRGAPRGRAALYREPAHLAARHIKGVSHPSVGGG